MSYNSRQICDTQYVEVCFKGIGQVRSEFSIGYVKTDVGFWEFPHWTINPLSRDCPLEVSVRMSCWTKRVFKSVSAAHWIWCPHAILKESPGFDNLSNVGKLTKSQSIQCLDQVHESNIQWTGGPKQEGAPERNTWASFPDRAFLTPGVFKLPTALELSLPIISVRRFITPDFPPANGMGLLLSSYCGKDSLNGLSTDTYKPF